MKKYYRLLILFLSLFSTEVFGQVFNRSFADNEDNTTALCGSHFQNAISVSTTINHALIIRKIDNQGNQLNQNTYFKDQYYWSPAGVKTMSDSTIWIYGSYAHGCDFLLGQGDFILRLAPNLDTLNFAIFSHYSLQLFQLLELPNGEYLSVGSNGIMQLNATLDSLYADYNAGLLTTGAAVLDANRVLVGTETWASSTPYWKELNIHSHQSTNINIALGGDLYDLSDSILAVWQKHSQSLYRLRKSDLSQINQLNNIANGLINADLYMNDQFIMALKSNRYKVFNLRNGQAIDSGFIHSTVPYQRGRDAAFIQDSVVKIATRDNRRQIHLESLRIGKAPSALWPVDHRLRNTGFEVLHIDTLPNNNMTLSFNSHWQLSLINKGVQNIQSVSLYHSIYPGPWQCLPEDTLIHYHGLNLAPDDSLILTFNNIKAYGMPLYSSRYNLLFNLRIAQVNGRIVGGNAGQSFSHSVEDVHIEENLLSPITFYPNPVGDLLWLESAPPHLEGVIIGTEGKLWQKIQWREEGQKVMDLSPLPPGIYVLILKEGADQAVHKIHKL